MSGKDTCINPCPKAIYNGIVISCCNENLAVCRIPAMYTCSIAFQQTNMRNKVLDPWIHNKNDVLLHMHLFRRVAYLCSNERK